MQVSDRCHPDDVAVQRRGPDSPIAAADATQLGGQPDQVVGDDALGIAPEQRGQPVAEDAPHGAIGHAHLDPGLGRADGPEPHACRSCSTSAPSTVRQAISSLGTRRVTTASHSIGRPARPATTQCVRSGPIRRTSCTWDMKRGKFSKSFQNS